MRTGRVRENDWNADQAIHFKIIIPKQAICATTKQKHHQQPIKAQKRLFSKEMTRAGSSNNGGEKDRIPSVGNVKDIYMHAHFVQIIPCDTFNFRTFALDD